MVVGERLVGFKMIEGKVREFDSKAEKTISLDGEGQAGALDRSRQQ